MIEPHYAGIPPETLPPLPRQPVHLVLDNLRSAYNVGSIFRTADAGAAAQVHLCGMSAHPPHRKLAKTALGAFDYVPWAYYERTKDCIEALRAGGIAVIAVETAPEAVPLPHFRFPQPAALVFGNEVTGIAQENLARCDAVVCIPMHGHKNTMNVATAAGVALYGVLAQWGAL
jgi:tRNA G18 (ribose-2'-O)-methylase SpoU